MEQGCQGSSLPHFLQASCGRRGEKESHGMLNSSDKKARWREPWSKYGLCWWDFCCYFFLIVSGSSSCMKEQTEPNQPHTALGWDFSWGLLLLLALAFLGLVLVCSNKGWCPQRMSACWREPLWNGSDMRRTWKKESCKKEVSQIIFCTFLQSCALPPVRLFLSSWVCPCSRWSSHCYPWVLVQMAADEFASGKWKPPGWGFWTNFPRHTRIGRGGKGRNAMAATGSLFGFGFWLHMFLYIYLDIMYVHMHAF